MKERVLSERYAKALFMLGTEEKALDRFQDEMGRFSKVVALEPNLLKLLSLRELSPEKKEKILEGLMLKLYLSSPIQNFLKLLFQRERITLFPYIAKAFDDLVRELERVIVAQVTVVDEKNTRDLVQELKKTLEKITNKKVEFQVEEDSKMIGGFRVTVGETVYDASLQGELERIKEQWI